MKKEKEEELNLWEYSTLGIEFFFVVFLFVLLGNYSDENWGTSPFGLLVGLIIGFAYGLTYLVNRTSRLKDKKKKDD